LVDEFLNKLEKYTCPKVFKKYFKSKCKKLDKTRKVIIDDKVRKAYKFSKTIINKLKAKEGNKGSLP
jgi:hypothetical protein